MNSRTNNVLSAVLLLSVAGLGIPLAAQPNQAPGMPNGVRLVEDRNANQQNSNDRQNANPSYRPGDYRSARWLIDRDITNRGNETIGTATDMIVDRGSGRISHIVVKSGSVLGLGGRSVLVPFREFQWDATSERLTLATSGEYLRQYPAFTESAWNDLRTSTPPESSGRGVRWMNERDRNTNMDNRDSTNTGGNGVGNPRPTGTPGNPESPSGTRNNNGNNGSNNTNTGTNNINPTVTPNNNSTTSPNTTPNNADRPNTNRDGGDNRSGSGNIPAGTVPSSTPGYWQVPANQAGATQERSFNDWMWNQAGNEWDDSYGSQWDAGSKQRVEGEVKRVDRTYSPHYGEMVVVEVAGQDGKSRKVALGPSWYVSGSETPISRGDQVTLEVMPVHIATSALVNGRSMALRDGESGRAAWTAPSFKYGKETYSAPYYQNVMLSKVRGAQLDCRGSVCGSVDDVIIDVITGNVAFLSIDPNQNFLGINDTKRLVPWSVATIAMSGQIRIDASKDMILGAMKTPSQLNTLNSPHQTDQIYSTYQVAPRTYDQRYDYNRWSTEQRQRNNDRRMPEPEEDTRGR